MKRVIVLGATGSIGVQALRVIAASSDLCVVGLSCDRNVTLLLEQAVSLGVADLAVADEGAAATVPVSLYPELQVRSGAGAAAGLVREVDADLILNGIVGFAGLESTLAALESGRSVALANKESLVCAGSLVRYLAERKGASILPVDSEHSALFQLVGAAGTAAVESLVITASGGPFRGWDRDALVPVTKEQALAHPTWSMGEKITVDSATLMNKGLEVIEASRLFGVPADRISVVVHPQSVVHSMVEYIDGSVLAQLGPTDMRIAIQYTLTYPERWQTPLPPLDIHKLGSLEFLEPDPEKFPCLALAYRALGTGGTAPAVLNAANEVAVEAFLDRGISFQEIPRIIETVLDGHTPGKATKLEEILKADRWAREAARACIPDRGCTVPGA